MYDLAKYETCIKPIVNINPNKRGRVAATQKQGMLEIILQLNRCCWGIFSDALLNRIVSIES